MTHQPLGRPSAHPPGSLIAHGGWPTKPPSFRRGSLPSEYSSRPSRRDCHLPHAFLTPPSSGLSRPHPETLMLSLSPSPDDSAFPCLPPVEQSDFQSRRHIQAQPKALTRLEPQASLQPRSCPGWPQPYLWGQRPSGPPLTSHQRLRLKVLSFRYILNFNSQKLPKVIIMTISIDGEIKAGEGL